MISNITANEVDWSTHHEVLSVVRREVFIVEQNVPEELEWDGLDENSGHVLAQDCTKRVSSVAPYQSIGTGRLVHVNQGLGHIGRMAIRKEYRRQGIGKKILLLLIEMAIRSGHEKILLHAQLYVVSFYQQAGFIAVGDTFMDAGIPHIKMIRTL